MNEVELLRTYIRPVDGIVVRGLNEIRSLSPNQPNGLFQTFVPSGFGKGGLTSYLINKMQLTSDLGP